MKELRMSWRSPYVRMQLIQGMIMPVVFAILFLREGVSGKALAFVPAGFLMMVTMMSYTNILGTDGNGIATLLMSPIRRERVFHAKAAAFGAVVGVPFLLAVAFALWAVPGVFTVAGAVAGLGVAMVTIAVFQFTSTLVPYPVSDDAKRGFGRQKGGFMAVVAMFSGLIVASIVSSPVWILMVVSVIAENETAALLTGAAGLVYGAFIYYIGTRQAAKFFMSRESQIYLALKPRQHD